MPNLRNYGLYSFVSLAIVFVSGGVAASTIAHPGPANGLIEKVTIFGFIQWLFVIALKMYSSEMTMSSRSVKTRVGAI